MNDSNSVDADTPVKIAVTAEDIADGQRGATYRCPIALAVRRATGVQAVSVRGTNGFLYGQKEQLFDLPAEAAAFIERYDSGQAVQPLAFDILPRPYGVLAVREGQA